MYVAGRPVMAKNQLEVFDKYTGESLARVSLAESSDVEQAISAAVRVRRQVEAIPPPSRYQVLMHCATRLGEQEKLFVETLIGEAGKPRLYAQLEVQRAIETFRCAAEESLRIAGEMIPLEIGPRSIGYRGMTRRVPVGVCGLVTPFNFPLNLVAHKVAPAIAAGCPWILKPASTTPLSALLLGDILAETDLVPESFSILPSNRNTADQLVTDHRLQMLSFTGSDTVGWDIKQRCGRKKICLELGGNAACLIDETYPWEEVIAKVATAAFAQAGQSCISIQRLFLHESIYEAAKQRLVQVAQELPCGDPRQANTVVGPLIDAKEASRTMAWIEAACLAGAKRVLAPQRIGNVITPAILEEVSKDQPIVCQEAFAPVLVLERFRDFSEGLAMINDGRFGLQAGIFTENLQRAMQAWDQLEVGGVLIGEVPSWRVDSMPYGGVKDSGIGREGVRYAIQEMTEPRLLVIRTPSTHP